MSLSQMPFLVINCNDYERDRHYVKHAVRPCLGINNKIYLQYHHSNNVHGRYNKEHSSLNGQIFTANVPQHRDERCLQIRPTFAPSCLNICLSKYQEFLI